MIGRLALGLAVAAAACLGDEPVPDPREVASLTIDEAVALASRQAALPSAALRLADARGPLVAVGLPEEAIQRLLADARGMEPFGAQDEVGLHEFLTRTRSPEWLAIRGRFREFLDLPALASPSSEVIDALNGRNLLVTLPAVTDLGCLAFGARAGGRYAFPRLESLSPDAATEVARSTDWLDFSGLESLDPTVAAALAGQQGGGLALGGLRSLPEPIARILSGHAQALSLRGLTVLDDAAAEALAGKEKGDLFLTGLRELRSVALAIRLGRQVEVSLPAADVLSPDAARALVEQGVANGRPRSLVIAGRALLDPAVGDVISRFQGRYLTLCGDFHLDVPLARRLAQSPCQAVSLRGLKRLDADVARELAAFRRELRLPRLEAISPAAAAALATHEGPLVLPDLNAFPPADVAAVVLGCARLDLSSLTAPTPELARLLAAREGSLVLPAVTTLSGEAAVALATHVGTLSLPRLGEIDAEVAAALAAHRGGGLGLHGLRRIGSQAATLLAAHEQPIDLHGLTLTERLDSTAVATLLVRKTGGVVLPNLRRFDYPESRRVAEILATAPGRLSLPQLEAVSPATLAALLRKKDVSLPPVEMLELIAEPDGAATDDFVDPRADDDPPR